MSSHPESQPEPKPAPAQPTQSGGPTSHRQSNNDPPNYDPLEPPMVGWRSTKHVAPPHIYPVDPVFQAISSLLQEKTYGAPRVFDLYTLMGITLAFALLFAFMKALGAAPEIFVSITCFVTLVAIGQMLLYGGNSPRLASLISGPIALLIVNVGLAFYYRNGAIEILCLLPMGIPLGYLAGGMVAGVFLVADELRKKFSKQVLQENETTIWDERD